MHHWSEAEWAKVAGLLTARKNLTEIVAELPRRTEAAFATFFSKNKIFLPAYNPISAQSIIQHVPKRSKQAYIDWEERLNKDKNKHAKALLAGSVLYRQRQGWQAFMLATIYSNGTHLIPKPLAGSVSQPGGNLGVHRYDLMTGMGRTKSTFRQPGLTINKPAKMDLPFTSIDDETVTNLVRAAFTPAQIASRLGRSLTAHDVTRRIRYLETYGPIQPVVRTFAAQEDMYIYWAFQANIPLAIARAHLPEYTEAEILRRETHLATNRPWGNDEIATIESQFKLGLSWQQIIQYQHDRTLADCQWELAHRHANPLPVWSPQKEAELAALREDEGRSWEEIGREVGFTAKECREQWYTVFWLYTDRWMDYAGMVEGDEPREEVVLEEEDLVETHRFPTLENTKRE